MKEQGIDRLKLFYLKLNLLIVKCTDYPWDETCIYIATTQSLIQAINKFTKYSEL